MTFVTPTPDQWSLCRGMTEFLAGNFPLSRFRSKQISEKDCWQDLASMGVFGISLPEADGGMGQSLLDDVLACREAGRYLISPALVGSILAVKIAAQTDKITLRDALISGLSRAGIATTAVNGDVQIVDGDSDGIFLLVQADRIAVVNSDASNRPTLRCIDDAVQLDKTEIRALAVDWLENKSLALAAHLLLAAMLCGLLETICEMAADYARTRVQFGRPIGAFQAIKHGCADIALATELCWSQTLQAASALQSDAADAEFHVLTAKLLAGDEALKAARFNIQVHGGMGFTDEVDAHRMLKRVHVLHQLLGDPRLVRRRLLDLSVEII